MEQAATRLLNGGMRLPPLPTIRDLVKLYKLQAIKQLSQNFLMDERLTDRIVKSAGRITSLDTVLEVGPGPGGITRSIMRRQPKRIILVEKDKRFWPTLELLRDTVAQRQLIMSGGTTTTETTTPTPASSSMQIDIFHEDILRFNIEEHLPARINDIDGDCVEEGRLHLIGNLPFSISTALLVQWLRDLSLRRGPFLQRNDTNMTLTFQKEVAERICAPLGHEQRCRLSIMSQIWTQPLLKFIIPGKAFVPKPDVDVGVVKLIPYKQPKTNLSFNLVEKVVRNIFNMRQKYCRRGYSNLFPEEHRMEITAELFELADVEDTLRPFELSVDECLRLATVYSHYIEDHPEVASYDFRAPKHLSMANHANDY